MTQDKTLADLLGEYKTLNEYIQAHSRALIGKAFAEFFERCPEVGSVMWTQYAPYFNDGDPCVFGVHDPELYAPDAEIEDYGEGGMLYVWRETDADDTPDEARIRSTWHSLLGALFKSEGERFMQAAFGDDAIITASRDGFDVQEYEHD